MNRRGFLQAILAAGVAPAFIGSSILMPVRNRLCFTEETLEDMVLDMAYMRQGLRPTIILSNFNFVPALQPGLQMMFGDHYR